MKKLLLSFLIICGLTSAAQNFEISLLKNLNNDSLGYTATPQFFTQFQNNLYFSYVQKNFGDYYYMVKSNGEDSNTNFVYTDRFFNPGGYTVVGNRMFFAANDSMHGNELWVTDGSDSGTYMVKDIYAGYKSSDIGKLTVLGNLLYFRATDSLHGAELWRSDGTSNGTYLVKDIATGLLNSNVNTITEFKGKLYFEASDSAYGFEFYVSDGTANGTMRLTTTDGFRANSFLQSEIFPYNQKMYFSAYNYPDGAQLWESDGTANGTKLFLKINQNGSSYPQHFILFSNKMCFVANNETDGFEIWSSDGTVAGTEMITDLNPNILTNAPENLIVYKNKLFFSLNDGSSGWELWSSTVSPNTATFLKEINPGSASSFPSNSFIYKDFLFFTATSSGYCQVWVTNGTEQFCQSIAAAGAQIKNAVCIQNFSFFEYQGKLYFPANYFSSTGLEIYRCEIKPGSGLQDTKTHTVQIYPNPAQNSLTFSRPLDFKLLNTAGQVLAEGNTCESIDISSLANGIYHLQTNDGLHFNVVIQH